MIPSPAPLYLKQPVTQAETQTKVCAKCGIRQSIDNFHIKRNSRDGRHHTCKKCRSEHGKSVWKEKSSLLPLTNHRRFDRLKVCTTCGIPKSLDNFNDRPVSPDGLNPRCKECVSKESNKQHHKNPEHTKKVYREWYENNKNKKYEKYKAWLEKTEYFQKPEYKQMRRDYNLDNFGVDREWYDKTLAAQGGGCAICASKIPGGVGRFHVDHDHRCCPSRTACDKCRRGLLCSRCNLRLGHLEDPEWNPKAVAYLKRHKRKDASGNDQPSLFDNL